MNSLFICHSVGDTNALIASAEELLKKNSQCTPVFLIIGTVAEKQWNALPIDSILKHSATVEIIPKEFIQRSETGTLIDKDFEVIKATILDHLIKKYEISNVLIGTPSQDQSSLAFQIAEYLAHHFKNNHLFVYNDYLFEEKAHCYWQVINNDESWVEKINWLVPLPAAKAKINDINPFLNVSVVGHLSLDTALSEALIDKNQIRQALAVGDTQSLLFISGSKDFSKDKELLEALFQALEKNPNSELQLRLGIHPGVADPNAYITAILKVVYQFPEISQQIKLLIKPSLMEKLQFTKDNQLFEKTILPNSLSSDEIACTADGIASTPPATLVTVAASQGKPAYYHEEDKASYLPPNRIFAGKDKLPSFFSAIKNKEDQQPMTRDELGLTEKTFVQVMSDKLTSEEFIPERLSLTS